MTTSLVFFGSAVVLIALALKARMRTRLARSIRVQVFSIAILSACIGVANARDAWAHAAGLSLEQSFAIVLWAVFPIGLLCALFGALITLLRYPTFAAQLPIPSAALWWLVSLLGLREVWNEDEVGLG